MVKRREKQRPSWGEMVVVIWLLIFASIGLAFLAAVSAKAQSLDPKVDCMSPVDAAIAFSRMHARSIYMELRQADAVEFIEKFEKIVPNKPKIKGDHVLFLYVPGSPEIWVSISQSGCNVDVDVITKETYFEITGEKVGTPL